MVVRYFFAAPNPCVFFFCRTLVCAWVCLLFLGSIHAMLCACMCMCACCLVACACVYAGCFCVCMRVLFFTAAQTNQGHVGKIEMYARRQGPRPYPQQAANWDTLSVKSSSWYVHPCFGLEYCQNDAICQEWWWLHFSDTCRMIMGT